MRLWLDAQLPPQLAAWLTERFEVEAIAVRELGLRDATDRHIFAAARAASAVLVSKDIAREHGAGAWNTAATCVGDLRQRHQRTASLSIRDDLPACHGNPPAR